ncbi:MAG TPA: hypothetical protein VIV14_08065 [Gammaproteobacteria bacterium]
MANLELHALGLLCGLGATSLATLTSEGWRYRVLFVAGFVAGAIFLGSDRFPNPTWVATIAAVAAAVTLWRPAWSGAGIVFGGVLGGLWISVLAAQGLPFFAATIIAVTLPGVAVWLCAVRTSFATPRLREEALVMLIGLGLVLATGPDIADGWRSAIALKAVPLVSEQPAGAGWSLAFLGSCALVGGLYSLWRRR